MLGRGLGRDPHAAPVGQPAYSQFVTQAANARGWFFAKIAEPATKTPITRVSATIFVMSPPRRELPESLGQHRCCSQYPARNRNQASAGQEGSPLACPWRAAIVGAVEADGAHAAFRFLPPNGRRNSSICSVATASGLLFHPPVRQSVLRRSPLLLLRHCSCPRTIELKI